MHAAVLDDRGLRRIIAMLVSFAAIAERAAGRSFPVRWLVLLILRRAEAVALQFVVEATQADWPLSDDDPQIGCRPEDAAWLGLRFRMLAAVLGALLDLCRLHHPPPHAPRRPVASRQIVMSLRRAPVPDDTS